MKELLAHCAAHEGIRESGVGNDKAKGVEFSVIKNSNSSSAAVEQPNKVGDNESATKTIDNQQQPTKKRSDNTSAEDSMDQNQPPPKKRSKASPNFLVLGAKRAREAKAARLAKQNNVAGCHRSKKDEKKSNTGSGVPFQQVLRLKYIKGFTQAVRNPCRLEDLA